MVSGNGSALKKTGKKKKTKKAFRQFSLSSSHRARPPLLAFRRPFKREGKLTGDAVFEGSGMDPRLEDHSCGSLHRCEKRGTK